MPLSPLHKEKLKKNLITVAIIFAWIAVIWVITMLQIQSHGVAPQ